MQKYRIKSLYNNNNVPMKLKLLKKALTESKFKGTYYLPRNQKEVRLVIELILQKRKENGIRRGSQLEIWPENMPSV
jgi:hypothetical protein